MNNKTHYKISTLGAWALAFGCVIGWGAFVMPGTTFLPATGPLGTGIAMTIGAVLMLVIGFNFHYMMNRTSSEGGAYAYTKDAFGRDQAFLCAWFLGLCYIALIPQNASALALICRYYLNNALQFGFHYQVAGYDVYFGEILLSEFVMLVFGLPFLLRERGVRFLQTLAALAIVTGAGIVLCAGAVHLDPDSLKPFFGTNGNSPAPGIAAIVVLAPWAFVGFDVLSLVTKEFRFPVKKSFRIIASSILTGVSAFISKPLFRTKLATLFNGLVKNQTEELDLEAPLRALEEMDLDGRRVLLAEDQELNAEIATDFLEMTGLTVDWAKDGKQAADMLAASPDGYYSMIFMDIQMPDMNGYEATRTIRALDRPYAKNIPIVAMTANAFAEDKINAKNAGMNEHIIKPIDVEALVWVLDKYIS